MESSSYDRFIEENPEEYSNLKKDVKQWLKSEDETPYPKTSEIIEDLSEEENEKGGFCPSLIRMAIDEMDFETWNPEAQNPRIKNPYAFND